MNLRNITIQNMGYQVFDLDRTNNSFEIRYKYTYKVINRIHEEIKEPVGEKI